MKRIRAMAVAGGVEYPDTYELNVRSSRPDPVDSNNPKGWFGDARTPDESAAGTVAMVYATCTTPNL